MTAHQVVGRSLPRVDGVAKVTGAARYTVDVTVAGMAHAAIVRAARAHARIVAIDTQAARSADGVLAVGTAADLDGLFCYYGHIITDHPILAIDKVRFMGEPVAIVVAETRHQAERAASLVRVTYEDLPAVVTLAEALATDAPRVHERTYPQGRGVFWETLPEGHPGNIAHVADFGWGDVDEAMAAADVVVESEAHYPMLYAYAMEPYCAVASYAPGSLDVTSSTQHPFMVREELARIFDLPLSGVRVRAPYLGGGYGSKSWTKVEPLAAVGSYLSGRPVRVGLTVEEAMLTTRADGGRVHVRSGFRSDGTILARDFTIDFNTGAYADSSPSILDKAVHRCFGPYQIPSLRVRARLLYTNTVPASSYRGFGAPQTNAAGEYNIDRAAALLGIDAATLRRRNLVAPGGELMPGKRPLDADLPADLDLLTEALADVPAHDDGLRYASGYGCSASDAGAYPASIAVVKVLPDGSALVASGAVEMGQGSATVLCQIAAEELGVAFERIAIAQSDTGASPLERTTNASRTTTIVGLAVQRACRDALERLADMAAETWGCERSEVSAGGGYVIGPNGRKEEYREVLDGWFGLGAGEAIGIGRVRPEGDLAAMPPFWEIGMSGVVVAVDVDTGAVGVHRLATVGDVGFAINPRGAEGQDLGAATQGLGGALFEQLVYDGGQLVNPNLVDYRVPRTVDMPRQLRLLLAERRDGVGPYGSKGGGEGALNPIGGAVASAIARAAGHWPESVHLPLTPERVWRLLHEAGDD